MIFLGLCAVQAWIPYKNSNSEKRLELNDLKLSRARINSGNSKRKRGRPNEGAIRGPIRPVQ